METIKEHKRKEGDEKHGLMCLECGNKLSKVSINGEMKYACRRCFTGREQELALIVSGKLRLAG